jgi:hypothetical protein
MNGVIDRLSRSGDIPGGWDGLAQNTFQKKEFLLHCEKHNPCRQRYYVLSSGETVLAGAVVYTLEVDLLTWMGIRSPVRMHIVGVPCSVSCPGIIGEAAMQEEILRGILRREKGLLVCLNIDRTPGNVPMSAGRTWPSVVFVNRFGSWEEYTVSLRSPYRRRLSLIERTIDRLSIQTAPCSTFTDEMHRLYLEVLERSEGKLEKLGSDFFRMLPSDFRLMTFTEAGHLCGWAITLMEADRFWFFLGGQDYHHAPREFYLAKLVTILRTGIESGAGIVDLGQSAEVPKTRLGGNCCEKLMLTHHHNPLLDGALRASMGMLSYQRRVPETHVYRDATP